MPSGCTSANGKVDKYFINLSCWLTLINLVVVALRRYEGTVGLVSGTAS